MRKSRWAAGAVQHHCQEGSIPMHATSLAPSLQRRQCDLLQIFCQMTMLSTWEETALYCLCLSLSVCPSVRLSLSLPLCVSRSLFASWIITNWFSTTPLADLYLTRPTNGHMPHWNLKHRSTARLSWGHSSHQPLCLGGVPSRAQHISTVCWIWNHGTWSRTCRTWGGKPLEHLESHTFKLGTREKELHLAIYTVCWGAGFSRSAAGPEKLPMRSRAFKTECHSELWEE